MPRRRTVIVLILLFRSVLSHHRGRSALGLFPPRKARIRCRNPCATTVQEQCSASMFLLIVCQREKRSCDTSRREQGGCTVIYIKKETTAERSTVTSPTAQTTLTFEGMSVVVVLRAAHSMQKRFDIETLIRCRRVALPGSTRPRSAPATAAGVLDPPFGRSLGGWNVCGNFKTTSC